MREELLGRVPLVCPRCRCLTEEAWQMHTVSVVARHRVAPDGDVVEGALGCDNPECRRRYPIVDGIPLLVPDLAGLLRSELVAAVEADLAPETIDLLVGAGPDGEPYPRLHEHLGTYLDAHWGDRAAPAPDGPARFGMAPLVEAIARAAVGAGGVDAAVELGCGPGRGVAELARSAGLVVGIDLHVGALRRARRILRGEPVAYHRRVAGRHGLGATIHAPDLAPLDQRVLLVCGDALDPPLPPRRFGRVAALNLLDSVRSPSTLLAVLDKLCDASGELLVSSPFTWQSGVVDEDERLGDADPAAALHARLLGGHGLEATYEILETTDLPWWLRRDARAAYRYEVRWLRARKCLPSVAR